MTKETRNLYAFMLFTWILVLLDAVCIHSWARSHVKEEVEAVQMKYMQVEENIYIMSHEINELKKAKDTIKEDVKTHKNSIHYGR